MAHLKTGWTYGAEHELADWPWDRPLPPHWGQDKRDITIVNSDGSANDPVGIVNRIGGEFNSPPTDTIEGQCELLEQLTHYYPEATVNYRSNLHCHIRVPGLKDDLPALKRVQKHIHDWMPKALPLIQLRPKPTRTDYPKSAELEGALRRWRRRGVSHQSLLKPNRLQRQLDAPTLQEFFEAEVPRTVLGNRPMWHAQPRLCVSTRQLLQTDTIEFRHFAGTLDRVTLHTCLLWCREYLRRALEDAPIDDLLATFRTEDFPVFPTYIHEMELRYRATIHDGTVPLPQIETNLARIRAEWTANPKRPNETLEAYWRRRS